MYVFSALPSVRAGGKAPSLGVSGGSGGPTLHDFHEALSYQVPIPFYIGEYFT